MELKNGVEPEFTMHPDDFRSQCEDETFWGIPIEYFTVENGVVRLDARLATKLKWNYDGGNKNAININAPAQKVTIDGQTLSIPPGFFCSYITPDDVVEE